ncbi:MAG TPA: hypothetical protein VF834_07525 [Streptosporangiaceae bacterium]
MAIAAAGAALVCAAAVPAVTTWSGSASGPGPGGFGQAAALQVPGQGSGSAGHLGKSGSAFAAGAARASGGQARASTGQRRGSRSRQTGSQHGRPPAGQHPASTPAVATAYQNPLRAVTGLIPERIDMGVDFGGSGSIYALGDGVVTQACGTCYGWPGGGWITYRLTSGPAAGLMVFVAEDVQPRVAVGQTVTPSTVIATMFNGGAGIETGWAMASTYSAESQLPEAGGISGGGPFPTAVGMNFEELLQALGVPAGNNRYATTYGILPAGYSPDWAAALKING